MTQGSKHKRTRLASPLLFLWACSPSAPEFVPFPALEEDELAVVVGLGGGLVVSQRGPYRAEGSVSREDYLIDENVELIVLAFRPDALRSLAPELDLERIRDLRVERRAPECQDVFHRADERSVPLGPIGARVLWLDGLEFVPSDRSLDDLALAVPADSDLCFGRATPELRPFGATVELWPDHVPVGPSGASGADYVDWRRIGVTPVSADLFVVSSEKLTAIVERGESWENRPERYWSLEVDPLFSDTHQHWKLRHLAVRSSTVTSGALELIMLANLIDEEVDTGDARSRLLRLHWSPAGFTRAVLLGEFEPALHRLGRLEDGRTFAIGDRGSVLVERPTRDAFEPLSLRGLDGARLRDWAAGPSETEPFVLLQTDHLLLFGQLADGASFRGERAPIAASGAGLLTGVEHRAGRYYLSPTGSASVVSRSPDGAREIGPVRVPDAWAECATPPDACGRRHLRGTAPILVESGHGTVVVLPTDCSGVLELEPALGCARTLRGLGDVVEPREPYFMSSGEPSPSGVALSGTSGRLIEVVW